MNISIRQLRAFTTIGRLGSFVEAARALHVTPAALSIVIRALEEELGFRVFDRTTRRVLFTEAGRQYFHYAEQVLADLRKAEMAALDLRNHKTGVVRVAMTPIMAWVLLPPVLAEFQQQWPGVRVEPVDVSADEMVNAVAAGQCDLTINFSMPVPEGLLATPLFRSRVHAVCHGRHRFARRKSLRWSELHEEPMIFIGQGSEMRIRSELPARVLLKARYEAGNTLTALGLAASGAGVVVCAGYVRPMAALHRLHVVPLADPVIHRPFMLYRSATRAPAPAVELFHTHLVQHFARFEERDVEDLMAA